MFQSVLVVTARDVQTVQLRRLEGRRPHAEQNVFESFNLIMVRASSNTWSSCDHLLLCNLEDHRII